MWQKTRIGPVCPLALLGAVGLLCACGPARGPSGARDGGKDTATVWRDVAVPDSHESQEAALPNDAQDAGGPQRLVFTWDPLIRHECYSLYADPPEWKGPALGRDCMGPDPKRWMFGSTNEDAAFSGGGSHDLPLDDPAWAFAFHPTERGTYQVGWVLDKLNTQAYWDRYTFVGFVDSWDVNGPPAPDLGQEVYVDFEVALMAAEQAETSDSTEVGLAKDRVLLGAAAVWNGRTHFLEVNLWRTENFDLCTQDECVGGNCCPPRPCDELGVYDRRFDCDPARDWPAGVYFDGRKLDLLGLTSTPQLLPGGPFVRVHLPIAALYRQAPWSDPPASWDGVTLAGVYLGIEVWGRGRVWIEFRDYVCYALLP